MRDVVWWRGEGEVTRAIVETFRGRAYREMSCRGRLQGKGLVGKVFAEALPAEEELALKGVARTWLPGTTQGRPRVAWDSPGHSGQTCYYDLSYAGIGKSRRTHVCEHPLVPKDGNVV